MQNRIRTLYKIRESKIKLYFIEIFTEMIISCNTHRRYFWHGKVLPQRAEKGILNSDCMLILSFV